MTKDQAQSLVVPHKSGGYGTKRTECLCSTVSDNLHDTSSEQDHPNQNSVICLVKCSDQQYKLHANSIINFLIIAVFSHHLMSDFWVFKDNNRISVPMFDTVQLW